MEALKQPSRRRNDSYNFRNLASEEAKEGILNDVKDLIESCPDDMKDDVTRNLENFRQLSERFLSEDGKTIEWRKILPPLDDHIKPYDSLEFPTSNMKEMLNKLVVVKLNGGLRTNKAMGCTNTTSLITVREEFTFLDMHVKHLESLNNKYGCKIPLVLMNSFNTHGETESVLRKYTHLNVPIHSFKQSKYPRIFKESFRTVPKTVLDNDWEKWYSPGHGDFYHSFFNSGLLQKFIDEGKEYIFVSNIDNLGATVDLAILNHLLSQPEEERCEFLMEVTDKTRADIKGGTLIMYEDKLKLLEIVQVPKDHIEDFKAVSKFKIFNTNNIWVQLSAMKHLIKSNQLSLEIIEDQPQSNDGEKVIQLETLIGTAIKHFNNSVGVNVPRSRFLPVKTCSDLFLVLSNLYKMKDGALSMNSKRQFLSTPLVQLGNSFKKVKEFHRRLDGIPDIIELDHLTVAGDVTFGRGIVLKGTVIIIANHGERIDIPPGSILENKIVSGNLRIMSH